MKRKKGFTLIELLAVIVILAIIALIATPIILNMINDAKKSAAKDSAYGYIEAIEYQNSMSGIDSIKYPAITESDVVKINSQVKVKGTPPTKGNVTITNGRVIGADLCINNYSVHYDGTIATIGGNACDGSSSEGNKDNSQKTYEVGEVFYYNPSTGKKCTAEEYNTNLESYKNSTSSTTATGLKEGCMKWYVYNNDGTQYSLILDHNTTATVAWNSSGKCTEGSDGTDETGEVKTALASDTANWKVSASLITADEIAVVTENESFDGQTTDSSGQYDFEMFQGQKLKYAWLYDNTLSCSMYQCDNTDSNIEGYWTTTTEKKCADRIFRAWIVKGNHLGVAALNGNSLYGVRPVIKLSK